MAKLLYTKKEQADYRQWLELDDRPQNLSPVQIYEHIDTKNNNEHAPVSIDEQGNLFVGGELALINKKLIPTIRHNFDWGLSHIRFRQLYGLPEPYSGFSYVRSPVDVHDMYSIFNGNVTPNKFWEAYWFSFVLHQREVLKEYIARNNRRLKWVGSFANPDNESPRAHARGIVCFKLTGG